MDAFIYHSFGGGWATDFGTEATTLAPDRSGNIVVPFLTKAENLYYGFDGGPHKAWGTSKVNSSALESGATVKGMVDLWLHGTAGSPTQHRVIHVGTTIKKDDADGAFTNLFTGLEAGKVPAYSIFEDILIMSSNSTTDVPKSWDGSTAQSLAGSPPNFAFSVTHKNRVWAAGNAAAPSRLYYSVLLDGEDWTGTGSGNIDIDPSDGDRITGLVSHKNELLVFKGPYKGSIHRIIGSAPTGTDPFARIPFIQGIGAAAHNTIFPFLDDIGFMWSDGTIHSLKATAAYGDFIEVALSRPINQWIRDHINLARSEHFWARNWPEKGIVLFAVTLDSGSDNNGLLMMDYRFQSNGFPAPRWADWTSFNQCAGCLANVVDAGDSNRHTIFSGGTDGFVRKLGRPDRSIDGMDAIDYDWQTPSFTYGVPYNFKTLTAGSIGFTPRSQANVTFSWQRDDEAAQTKSVGQGGTGAVLGDADSNEFILDTSTLAGSAFVNRFFDQEEGGEFRSISFGVSDSTLNADVEIHSFGAAIQSDSTSTEN